MQPSKSLYPDQQYPSSQRNVLCQTPSFITKQSHCLPKPPLYITLLVSPKHFHPNSHSINSRIKSFWAIRKTKICYEILSKSLKFVSLPSNHKLTFPSRNPKAIMCRHTWYIFTFCMHSYKFVEYCTARGTRQCMRTNHETREMDYCGVCRGSVAPS